jgi:hypothetical protein
MTNRQYGKSDYNINMQHCINQYVVPVGCPVDEAEIRHPVPRTPWFDPDPFLASGPRSNQHSLFDNS